MIGQVIERQIAKHPLFANNPAIAGHMNDIIQAAQRDPLGFQQRLRQLGASGVTPQTVTEEQIAMLIGNSPGFPPGSTPPPGTIPTPSGTIPAPTGTLPPPPTRANPVAGQPGGGYSPTGVPHEFGAPPPGPFSNQAGSGGWTPDGAPDQFTAPPPGPFGGPQPGFGSAPPPPASDAPSDNIPPEQLSE
jgi:hypothetical protein